MGLLKSLFAPGSTSEQWKLNATDFLKSITMYVLSAVVTVVGESVANGAFVFDWPTIWHAASAAAVAYLIKNLATKPAPPTT